MKVSYGIPSVRYYVLMGTLMWFSFGAFGALEPLFYRDVVKTGIETIGYMNSIFGLGIGVGAFLLTKLPSRATSARGLAIGAALMGAGAAIYVGTPDLRIIALGALFWGLVIGATEPLLRTLMQSDAPPEYVGRVMGTAQVHRSAGEIVPLGVGARSRRGVRCADGDDRGCCDRGCRGSDHAAATPPSSTAGAPTPAPCASTRPCRPTIRSARSPDARRLHRSSRANNRSAIHRPSMSAPACYSDRDILWFRRRSSGEPVTMSDDRVRTPEVDDLLRAFLLA